MRRLCVGSGQRPFDQKHGWINVDTQERWKPDLLCDMRTLPYEDGTVEMVVAHHTLEHLGLTEAQDALKEWRRVLQPGGSLLVFVPNAPEIAKRYLSGEFSEYTFAANMYGAYMGNEADYHRWCYSYRSLHAALMEAGFAKVKLFDWREIPGADIAQDGRWILGVEAVI
jgi:predicted SAM-dependent methyltransferase